MDSTRTEAERRQLQRDRDGCVQAALCRTQLEAADAGFGPVAWSSCSVLAALHRPTDEFLLNSWFYENVLGGPNQPDEFGYDCLLA